MTINGHELLLTRFGWICVSHRCGYIYHYRRLGK